MASLAAPLAFPLGGILTILTDCDVWAEDLIAVTFAVPMKNDVFLQASNAYVITPLDGGAPVVVNDTQTGNEVNPKTIYLITTPPTVGKLYRITFQSLYAVDGNVVEPIPCKFIGRNTKEDSIIRSRPQMYDMSPGSDLRKMLQAIGRQDDLIGGSRKDKIFPINIVGTGSMVVPGWNVQRSGTADLNHVYGFGTLNIYAVGDLGTITHWNGSDWAPQTSGTAERILRVWGFNAAAVWAVGENGTILKTTDNGVTWVPQLDPGGGSHIFSIWGSSPLDFWICCATGRMFHTVDGGVSYVLAQTLSNDATHLWGTAFNAITAALPPPSFGTTGFAYWQGAFWSEIFEGDGDRGVWGYGIGPALEHWNFGSSGGSGFLIHSNDTFGFGVPDTMPATVKKGLFIFGNTPATMLATCTTSLGSHFAAIRPSGPINTPPVASAWVYEVLPIVAGDARASWVDASGVAVLVGQFGNILYFTP